MTGREPTVREIYNSFNRIQKEILYYLVGETLTNSRITMYEDLALLYPRGVVGVIVQDVVNSLSTAQRALLFLIINSAIIDRERKVLILV